MELLYTGSAPGQAGEIEISGQRFRRGEVYTVDEEFGEVLLAKGGFYPIPIANVFEDEPVLSFEEEEAELNEAAMLDAAADCEA
jgi:hypothetical protein